MKTAILALSACLLLAGCAARSDGRPQAPAASAASPDGSVEARAASTAQAVPAESALQQEPQARSTDGGPPQERPPEEDWALLLVNSSHPLGAYEPELEEVQNGYRMDARVAPAARRMIADAAEQGVELLVCSAYRPRSSQERNFNASVDRYVAAGYSMDQAVSSTRLYIAEPGTSEHETGLAADIVTPAYQALDEGYAGTDAAKWLLEHAADYGFILRYPADKTERTGIAFEPWHYRYVGERAAREIMGRGLCLEEYLERPREERD